MNFFTNMGLLAFEFHEDIFQEMHQIFEVSCTRGLWRAMWQNILQGMMGSSEALGCDSQGYCHKGHKVA